MFEYFLACIGTAGAFYGIFAAADDAIALEKKKELSQYLSTLKVRNLPAHWETSFVSVFESVYGKTHHTLFCLYRSSISSLTAVFILFLLWASNNEDGVTLLMPVGSEGYLIIVLAPIIINILPDYFSLLQTRLLLNKILLKGNVYTFLVLDLIFTLLIATAAYFIGACILFAIDWELGETEIRIILSTFTSEVLKLQTNIVPFPFGVLFYSTFVATLWIWLFIIGVYAIRNFHSLLTASTRFIVFLNIEQYPLKSIGFLAMLLIISLYIIALPVVVAVS